MKSNVFRSDISVQQCVYAAHNFRALREKARISQVTLARETWISSSSITRCEAGDALPSLETVVRAIDAFRAHGVELPVFDNSMSLNDILSFLPVIGRNVALGRTLRVSTKTLENWRYKTQVVPGVANLAKLEERIKETGVEVPRANNSEDLVLVINED